MTYKRTSSLDLIPDALGALRAPIAQRVKKRAQRTPAQITINGKFLGGNLTANGVHRAALHFSEELIARSLGTLPARIVTPGIRETEIVAQSRITPELLQSQMGGGQLWEMLTLPHIAKNDLLVNFCNLAPILHPNSIVMIHDVQTLLHPDAYHWRQVQGYRAMWPLIGKRARAILTVSEHSRQSLADNGIGTLDKIFVVPNGTDHVLKIEPDTSILDRLDLQTRPFGFVLGSSQSYKNMRTLFQSVLSTRTG